MGDTKTYTGGCHCGAVRYEVSLDLASGTVCNCSICSKAGWFLTFASASSFKLLSGEDNLTDYQFGKRQIHHVFCKTCGVRSFSSGEAPNGRDVRAVNVRCLDDVDIDALEKKKFDGKSL